MKLNKINSVQEWLPYEEILPNGVIKLKDNSLVKILIISPINFNLKSNLEKESILNSYKLFLKTCNFNLQILIQSKKEDLSKHISKIEEINKKEINNLNLLSEKYREFIQVLNREKKSSSKNFYILIKEISQNKKNAFGISTHASHGTEHRKFNLVTSEISKRNFLRNKKQILEKNEEKILCEKLNDNYFKIKECLSKCGNIVTDSDRKETTSKIIYSFLNTRKELISI